MKALAIIVVRRYHAARFHAVVVRTLLVLFFMPSSITIYTVVMYSVASPSFGDLRGGHVHQGVPALPKEEGESLAVRPKIQPRLQILFSPRLPRLDQQHTCRQKFESRLWRAPSAGGLA